MKFRYRLVRKTECLEWYNKQSDQVKAACFLEQDCGSNYKASVHLCVNGETSRKIIMRVGQNAFDWFDVKPLESSFINVRYFGITGLKTMPKAPPLAK